MNDLESKIKVHPARIEQVFKKLIQNNLTFVANSRV